MTNHLPDLAPFLDLLGPKGWRQSSGDLQVQARDWLNRHGISPLGIAMPSSTEDVASTVKLAAAAGLSITPQGGNTSLNGGSVVTAGSPSIILSLARMNRIRAIDQLSLTATVEAGVVLAHLHEILARNELMLPLHLGAEGSAQIGGLIGTNAGGSHAMRYGLMEAQVLGLEVVLPDGSVWHGLRNLIKDNAGYALRRLFCGAEGTLGIITCASLRLQPTPRNRSTALLAVAGLQEALSLSAALQRGASELLAAIEFFCEPGLSLLLKHAPELNHPFAEPSPVYVLAELQTSAEGIDTSALLESVLEPCFDSSLVRDGIIAANEAQRTRLWKLREELPEGQRREGAQIKHDVAVPVRALADFVRRAADLASEILPGVRVIPFGHLGDGNVHLNLSPPLGAAGFQGREEALSEAIYALAAELGGTFSAEHGLGATKVALADRLRAGSERWLMRAIKQAIDPEGRMNPGKIVAYSGGK